MPFAPLCLVRSSVNVDETFVVPRIVRPGETISSSRLVSRSGGKGANVSAAIALAGAQVELCAAVGKDADWPVDQLEQRGVGTHAVQRLDDVPTGRAFIQIAEGDGENSIVLLKGANYHIDPSTSDPSRVFAALPRAPTHLVLQNEIPLDVTLSFLSHAHAQGCVTVLNPSPMLSKEELKALKWEQLDVLIVNAGEAVELLEALGGGQAVDEDDGESILKALDAVDALSNLSWLVVTRGAKGVQALVRTSADSARSTFSLPASKPFQVKDTTGAGDTFAGNLVAALMSMETGGAKAKDAREVEEVLRWAGQAAAMAVEKEGALESIPDRQAVQQRLDGSK